MKSRPKEERTTDININLRITVGLTPKLQQLLAVALGVSRPPVKAILKLGGNVPGQITVDTTQETVTVQFVDSHQDKVPAPPGVGVSFTSSDETVATIAADPGDPMVGRVTPVAVGTVSLGATLTGATEPDGVTAMPDPDPVALEVDPGQPVGARLSLSI